MELIKINSNAIEVTWTYVKDLVQKPIDRTLGERNVDDIYYSLIHEQLTLWVAVDKEDGIIGIMITQILFHPQYKVLALPLIGAKPHTINKWFFKSWEKDSPLLQYARENNCKRIEGYARDGWLKMIEKIGFKKYNTVVTKDVEYYD
jgi:hypothetical protein